MFNEKFTDKEFDLWKVAWNQGRLILSDILNEDFEDYYKRMSVVKSGSRAIGWTDEGFVPDEMMNEIMHSLQSSKEIFSKIEHLSKKII